MNNNHPRGEILPRSHHGSSNVLGSTTISPPSSSSSSLLAGAAAATATSAGSGALLVQFGDLITLTCERHGEFMQLRGITDRSIVVQSHQSSPSFSHNFEKCVLEILPIENEEISTMDSSSLPLRYGQMVRLRSTYMSTSTGGDIAIRRRQHAVLDPKCVRVQISTTTTASVSSDESDVRSTWFRVMPRYKVRNIGERVRYGDRILLECGSLQHQFLSTSTRPFPSSSFHEVLASDFGDTWTINAFDTSHRENRSTTKRKKRSKTSDPDQDDHLESTPATLLAARHRMIHACEPVVLFHKEAEGLLTLTDEAQQQDGNMVLQTTEARAHHQVVLDLLDVPQNFDIQALQYSSNSLWVVELEENTRGGILTWNTHYRLRHVASGRYLSIMEHAVKKEEREQEQKESKAIEDADQDISSEERQLMLTTVDNPLDPESATIFTMARFDLLEERLCTSSFMRLFNVKHQVYVTADNNALLQRVGGREFQPIGFSRKPLYADVFVIHPVSREELGGLHQLAAAVPVFSEIIDLIQSHAVEYRQNDWDNTDELVKKLSSPVESATSLLVHLILFCFGGPRDKRQIQLIESVDTTSHQSASDKYIPQVLQLTGVPVRKAQSLMFDQSFHKKIISLLAAVQQHDLVTLKELSTSSKYTKLYNLARLSYKMLTVMIQAAPDLALHLQNDIGFMLSQLGYGLYAAETLRELFTDNLALLSRLQSEHVRTMVNLLAEKYLARYLSFLRSLCVCNDKPIVRNQNTVLRLLFKDTATPASDRDSRTSETLPRQTRLENGALFIRSPIDNPTGQWIPLKEFNKSASKEQMQFLEETIFLYAALCQGRNEAAMSKLESIISCEEILHVVFDKTNFNVSTRLRTAYLSLLTSLYVDRQENDIRSRQQTSDGRIAVIWETFGQDDASDSEHPVTKNELLGILKPHILEYLQSADSKGSTASQAILERDQNHFTTCMIALFKTVMLQGTFDESELVDMLLPMIQVLNGKNDVYSHDPLEQVVKYDRFENNVNNSIIMECKTFVCETLSQILDNQIVVNAHSVLRLFKQQVEDAHANRRYVDLDLSLPELDLMREVCDMSEFLARDSDGQDNKLVSILLDLLQYDSDALVNASFTSLFKLTGHLRQVVDHLRKTTLLLTDHSIETYHVFIRHVESLKKLEVVDVENWSQVIDALRELESGCIDLSSRKRRPYLEHQRMLLHLGAHDVVIDNLIRMLVDDPSDEATKVLQTCVDFLRGFCRRNLPCQLALFPHLEYLISALGTRVVYGPLLDEIFRNNRELCQQCPEQFIWHVVALITHRGRFPRLLKFLKNIVRCSNVPIPRNQVLVMKYLLEQGRNTMVLINEFSDEQEIMRLIKEKDYENNPESLVRYHLELVSTIANCCRGLASHTEIQAQALIPLDVVLSKVLTRRDVVPIYFRYRYLKFLEEVYITTGHGSEALENSDIFTQVLNALLQDIRELTPKLNPSDDTLIDGFSLKRYMYKGLLQCVCALLARLGSNASRTISQQQNTSILRLHEGLVDAFCHEAFCSETQQPYIDMLLTFAAVAEKYGFAGKVMHLRDTMQDARRNIFDGSTVGSGSINTVSWEDELREFIVAEYAQYVQRCEETLVPLMFSSPSTGHESLLMSGGFHRLAQVLLRNLKQCTGIGKTKRNSSVCSVFFSHLNNSSLSDQHRIDIMLTAQQMLHLEEESGHRERVHTVQKALVSFGLCGTLVELIDSKEDKVVSTSIDTLILLLEAGADDISGVSHLVQRALFRYLLSRRDLTLFASLFNRLQHAIDMANKTHSMLPAEQEIRMHSIQLVTRVLRLLQLFCEGHYQSMQDYIRHQFDNLTSHDLVTSSVELFKVLTSDDLANDFYAADCVLQTINTLIDFCQGPCKANQMALVTAGVCAPINALLLQQGGIIRVDFDSTTVASNSEIGFKLESSVHGESGDSYSTRVSSELMEEIQIGCVTLLLSLLEGCSASNRFIPSVVSNSLSLDSLIVIMNEMYKNKDVPQDLPLQLFILLRILAAFDDSRALGRYLEQQFDGYQSFSSQVATIEILRENELEAVWFSIPDVCRNISKETKDRFLDEVDRSNQISKLQGLLEESDNLIFEAELQHELHSTTMLDDTQNELHQLPIHKQLIRRARRIAITREPFLNDLSLLLSALINVLLIYFVRANNDDGDDSSSFEFTSYIASALFKLFAVAHVSTQLLLCLHFIIARLPIILHHHEQDEMENEHSKDDDDTEELKQVHGEVKKENANELLEFSFHRLVKSWIPSILLDSRLQAMMYNPHLLYQLLSVICSICGLLISPFFFAVHLLDLVRRSPLLQNVISAVTSNGRSLLLTALLGMVIVYMFTALGFLFHRDKFMNDDFGEDIHFCSDLYQCFLFTLANGIRSGGGIGELLVPPDWRSEHIPLGRVLFDTSFFAVVIVILMNILFGQIIDTFAESRDEKRAIEEDMKNRCFICGIDSKVFDQRARGFEHHVCTDHNIWNYVYFLHHLRRKPASEYTGQETYVQELLSTGNLSFFPINRALVLEQSSSSSEGRHVEDLNAKHGSTAEAHGMPHNLPATNFTPPTRVDSHHASSMRSSNEMSQLSAMEISLNNHLQRLENRVNALFDKMNQVQVLERRAAASTVYN